jgi:CRP-like cAMP-binding protein
MRQTKIFALTSLGSDEVSNPRGQVTGDDRRILSLIDGISSVEGVGKKVPPSVRAHLDNTLEQLFAAGLIVDTGKGEFDIPLKKMASMFEEKVQLAIEASKTATRDIVAFAELELERRTEAEHKLASTDARLMQASMNLALVTNQYELLKQQVYSYKQGMEARIVEQQGQLVAVLGQSKEAQSQRFKLESELNQMRSDFVQLQDTVEKKAAHLDETLRLRVLEEQHAEQVKREQLKVAADEVARSHPHYAKIRGLEFFKDFRDSDLAELLLWTEWKPFREGQTVLTEGETSFPFYIIVSGKLDVVKGGKELVVLKAGEPFGEISYLDDDNPHRSASVVAKTDCELLLLDPSYLDNAAPMLRMCIAEAIVRIQSKRLRRALNMVVKLLVDQNATVSL